uniref:Apple domain-containing protein n=1 Tax=Haemonchus contortus TaxID=6289 RepID=A0A7I4Y7D5_HAECO
MILLRQHLKASLVSFIFLLQVRQALFCTFTENPHHSGVWASYISLIKIVTVNSTGACLKMCLEEIPECINYQCNFYKASEDLDYFSSGPEIKGYTLERNTTDVGCPLAVSLFPA